ncbi:tropomyosin beta chain isoform X2 [Hydra vulgaris]|uniref:Tropomyosin beta chain isoform X2 n=1 Tax=Hydra vulgaris TaxID=6087 RepID=A0ABM4BHQ1_HYDVU
MQAVKEAILDMIEQSQYSEDRIKLFESALRSSKRHLENILNEKESLMKKLENSEMKIISVDQQRCEVADKLKAIEIQIDQSELHRRVLEEKELESDNKIIKLEYKLCTAKNKYEENILRYEEAKQRLAELNSEYNLLIKKQTCLEQTGADLEQEAENKTLKLISLEKSSEQLFKSNANNEDHLRYLENDCRLMNEKQEATMLNVARLQKLIETTKDKIETLQMKKKTKEMELKNALHATKKE